MKITAALLSGAGNTFHIIHEINSDLTITNKKNIAKKICSLKTADGFIFLNSTNKENHFKWDFYNNDGSDAEMCGNATRCVGHYIKNEIKSSQKLWVLETKAGRIQIEPLSNDQYQITMTPLLLLHSKHGFFCNTGVPHLVLVTNQFENYKAQKNDARQLRTHPDFSPAGTNVTYIQTSKVPSLLKAVTYERGVEDFTEACGTGAVAAAFYNFEVNGVVETTVEMPGGSLMMNLTDLNHPLMTGPALLIGKYNYEFEI